jgi:hypothetical protein
MVYITGPDDTLRQLKEKTGTMGSLEVYEKTCLMCNPEMCAKYPNYRQKLPPYTPIFLISEEPVDNETRKEIWYELSKYSDNERQGLYELQEEGADIPTQVAVSSLMEDLQSYAATVRQWLKTPLILTPWEATKDIVTNKHIFKAFGEGTSHVSTVIKGSDIYTKLDTLYEHMLARDELNRKLHMLQGQKGMGALKKSLENQIKDLTQKIKLQLPKKLDAAMVKYLRKKFSPDAVKKMRANSYSAKAAKSGRLLTTNLQVLDRSGLGRLRTIVKELKRLGKGVNQAAKMLNYGIVLYDTYDAYNKGGNVARTFITGGLAVYLSSQAVAAVGGTAALGGIVIGGGVTASNLVLGSTVLVCCPIVGWTALIVGLVAAAVVSYGVKKSLEGVWDLGDQVSQAIYKKAVEATNQMRQEFESAWLEGSSWLMPYYGSGK